MPLKPIKHGIKAFALVDSLHKFVLDFQVYAGAVAKSTAVQQQSDDLSHTEQVTLDAVASYHFRNHVLVRSTAKFRMPWLARYICIMIIMIG